jgi:CPA1 family monovalent cation:H+ antiporter
VRDRIRFEGYQMLEYTNARTLAREQALVDAEVALDEMLGQPDPLAAGTDAREDGADPLAAGTASGVADEDPISDGAGGSAGAGPSSRARRCR